MKESLSWLVILRKGRRAFRNYDKSIELNWYLMDYENRHISIKVGGNYLSDGVVKIDGGGTEKGLYINVGERKDAIELANFLAGQLQRRENCDYSFVTRAIHKSQNARRAFRKSWPEGWYYDVDGIGGSGRMTDDDRFAGLTQEDRLSHDWVVELKPKKKDNEEQTTVRKTQGELPSRNPYRQ